MHFAAFVQWLLISRIGTRPASMEDDMIDQLRQAERQRSQARRWRKAASVAQARGNSVSAAEIGACADCSDLAADELMSGVTPPTIVAGEVVPTGHEFYSYEAKYLDEDGSELLIPAPLPVETLEEVRRLAVAAFRAIDCAGMARVDFFLAPEGRLLVNEVNTIPGFTQISMYPKLWEASGLPYPDLIDRLIELALERHALERKRGTGS